MLLSAQYIVPVSSDPIENGAVLVRGDSIVDIGSADMMALRYPDEEVRDFGMAAIMPGFIDLHASIEDSVFRGLIHDLPYAAWMKEMDYLRSRITPEETYDSAFLGGLEALSSGITTIADITSTGACVSAAQKLGLRGVFYRQVAAIDKRLVNYALKKADGDLEKWTGSIDSSRIGLGLAPAPTFQCHPLLYRRVSEYANSNGDVPLAMCLASSREEYRFVKYGAAVGSEDRSDLQGFMELPPWLPTAVTPVNYVLNWGAFNAENVMAIHCVCVKGDDIAKLKEHDVAVAVCPSFNAQLGMGVAPVSEFLRSGMRVGLGTDAPGSLDFVDIFTEMRVELLVQRAMNVGEFMSSQTLLEMGTLRSAEVLRLQDKIGSLEVGKLADIVAVDLSGSHQTPTSDPISAVLSSASNGDVMMTMVGGNVLYERGQWHVDGEVAKNIAHVLDIRGRLRSQCEDRR